MKLIIVLFSIVVAASVFAAPTTQESKRPPADSFLSIKLKVVADDKERLTVLLKNKSPFDLAAYKAVIFVSDRFGDNVGGPITLKTTDTFKAGDELEWSIIVPVAVGEQYYDDRSHTKLAIVLLKVELADGTQYDYSKDHDK